MPRTGGLHVHVLRLHHSTPNPLMYSIYCAFSYLCWHSNLGSVGHPFGVVCVVFLFVYRAAVILSSFSPSIICTGALLVARYHSRYVFVLVFIFVVARFAHKQ